MGGKTFDALSHALQVIRPRRVAWSPLGRVAVAAFAGKISAREIGSAKKKKRRRKRCIKNSVPFEGISRRCKKNKDCCGPGRCCDFGDGRACFNLLTNPTACGTSCGAIENCLNLPGDAICVDGQCESRSQRVTDRVRWGDSRLADLAFGAHLGYAFSAVTGSSRPCFPASRRSVQGGSSGVELAREPRW